MSDLSAQIAANVACIRDRLASACDRCGRSPNEVRLVAVTKYARLSWVQSLVALGHLQLGESRPQQLVERAGLLDPSIDWHLIGHLQRNKVRTVLPCVALIHSVDSLRLAQRINDVAAELELRPAILLEVNVSGEASKDGFDSRQLERDWPELIDLPHVRIAGLMTMAPASDDPQDARPTFRRLKQLRDQLLARSPADIVLGELSMGMSEDYEVAVEEGATIVRIGSAVFAGLE